jgi:penicillin-binding protein 2
MEAGWDLPGVSVEEAPVREYPAGPTLAHILGFTGSIPSAELADYTRRGYAIYDIVGRSGLEATYENMLRGAKGEKMIEVDAAGRELRVVGQPAPPLAGDSLVLALDLDFQRQVEDILQAALESLGARTGAVVAIDPRNGAVKALVSLPTFDNNMFSTGASPGEFAALLEDSDRPLLNRSISGLYPPGSTFKMITAAAALQEGVVDPGTRIVCPGMIVIPNQYDPAVTYPFVCWNRGGHGAVNTVEAIAQSCDVYFYEVSGGYHEYGANQPGLGSERLGHYARLFGLGEPTGIELLGEATGRVPSPDWLSDTKGMVWTTGRTYQMGIGQSDTLVTPLQLASVTAAVANGGHLLEPHLVDKVVDPNGAVVERPGGEIRTLPVDPSYLAVVREGMRGAVTHGTALASWSKLPTEIAVAGKTGTAEFCDPVVTNHGVFCRYTKDGNLLTHAWFVAFAPYDDPEIALAVFIDGSGLDHVIEGSQVAAPVAADVLRAYFHLPAPQPPSADCADCPEAAGAVSPSTAPPVAPTECAGCADAVPAATQTLP